LNKSTNIFFLNQLEKKIKENKIKRRGVCAKKSLGKKTTKNTNFHKKTKLFN